MSIFFNNSRINDWNFGDDNIIKVYRNNAIVFYKVSGESPTPEYQVCFAVVDDISQYTDREFEDVYDNATEKWYKLNNLNQYEKYGVYGSGRTSCEGSSRLPQGYTEVEYISSEDISESVLGPYIDTNYKPTQNTRFVIEYQSTTNTRDYQRIFGSGEFDMLGYLVNIEGKIGTSGYYYYKFGQTSSWYTTNVQCDLNRHIIDYNNSKQFLLDNVSIATLPNISFTCSSNLGIFWSINTKYTTNSINFIGRIFSAKVYENGILVRDFVPCISPNNVVGMYDIVNNVFYTSSNNYSFKAGEPIAPTDCVTTYEGKLTIDDGYEYEWNGSSWVNLGEVSGSSKTSDFKIGDIKERVTTGVSDGDYLLFSYYRNSDISKPENIMSYNPSNNYLSNLSGYGITTLDSTTIIDPSIWLLESTASANTFYIKSIKNNMYWGYQSRVSTISLNLVDSSSSQKAPVLITPSCKENCYGFVEKKSNASTGYGGYGLNQLNNYTYQLNWWNKGSSSVPCTFFSTDGNSDFIIYKMNASDAEYPKYYSDKSEPLDNLTFNTLAEAQTYAYNNCVYDGMKAIIDGDRYYFDSNDENGWVKVTEYYIVEDVTSGGASGWTISGSDTYNPDSSYYDDFSVELNSSYQTKIAKVTIYGYENFTYYLRSTGYSSYAYVTSSNVDELTAAPTSMSYNSSSAITNTYNFNKAAGSAVNLSNYRRVTYNNLDKTVEHTFYVVFYDGYYYSSYPPSATLLIPKEQTNENWEQVTFSASSNVALAQKNLFIDGNNSSSGGTQYWYYRWMVGLPSGSHSSSTNYSNYSYCPNATSSTFTSVAGEQRQVNFTYDNTTDKTLLFRLTDGSGNVLTPSDTVYYSMTLYNSCGVSNSIGNVTFPRFQSVKVGGSFSFSNSSNRHYIYGYSPNISLYQSYYVDNYQNTFDITYTKLSEEAVTITYTTYDPSDVETPSFKTDITYPYSGGTTSSTTLTSFEVPYTYPYEVNQTNNKFSADSQSYTANQAARTINFVLYPNNREFASVADLEAYAYAWEGMKATVGDTKYKYENGEWIENQHSLPDVPFTVNYNAKQYNASTKTLLKTEGQLADVDAVITEGTPTVNDGYLTIAANTRARISGYQNYFNRTNSTPNLTIISKQRTDGSNGHMFANRDSNYNWMYRCYSNKLTLHGTSEQGSVAVTTQPVIESVRVNSSRLLTYNNYTNNTSSTYSSFNYGSTNSTATALFAGYAYHSGEWFVGDFYWVYMCQGTLTDEQVQQVIDYNENL